MRGGKLPGRGVELPGLAETCTAILLDDRSLSRSGSWTDGTSSAYYRSTGGAPIPTARSSPGTASLRRDDLLDVWLGEGLLGSTLIETLSL
jgi:hypothetical protein